MKAPPSWPNHLPKALPPNPSTWGFPPNPITLGWGFQHIKRVEGNMGFPGGSVVKNLPANAGDTGDAGLIPGLARSVGGGNSNPLQYSCLGKPWTEGTDGLQSMESLRVGHDWATEHTQRETELFSPKHTFNYWHSNQINEVIQMQIKSAAI